MTNSHSQPSIAEKALKWYDLLRWREKIDRLERQASKNARSRIKQRRMRASNRQFNRGHGIQVMNEMTEDEFQQHFRMPRELFDELQAIIEADISKDPEMGRRSSGSGINAQTRLAVTLRFLAGGSHLDISALYGISLKNFFNVKYGVLWSTIDALDRHLPLTMSLDPATLQRKAERFAEICGVHPTSGGEIMFGCVEAFDGWVMETRCPTKKEVGAGNVKAYRNRKSCWGLVIMAGCDADLNFDVFAANSSGSTHDSIALEFTGFKQSVLDANRLPGQYYVIGDEAFKCTNQFLVPFSGTGLGLWKDSFNYHLSSMRQTIERAFGMLTKRWGIFWRPLNVRFEMWPTIALVCAKLHNWCNARRVPIVERAAIDRQRGDEWIVRSNPSEPAEGQDHINRQPQGNRRNQFAQAFEDAGLKRPEFASINSRAH